VGELFVLIEK